MLQVAFPLPHIHATVLLYRNGGVYVGQWERNLKHGLGVLLDNTGEDDGQTTMPSFRYEGQWYEDMPQGLGVEESETSSFFGYFVRGEQRYGRGVRLSVSTRGIEGCEVIDGSFRMPLLESLEAEMATRSPTVNRS